MAAGRRRQLPLERERRQEGLAKKTLDTMLSLICTQVCKPRR